MKLHLQPPFDSWHGTSVFDTVAAIEGKVYRQVDNRRTVEFTHNRERYFVKYHGPARPGTVLKSLLRGGVPTLTASDEWRALKKLALIGHYAPEPVGFGYRGLWPLWRQSFVIMRALSGYQSFYQYCLDHYQHLKPTHKRQLIAALAKAIRIIHDCGINHRDLYLEHFYLQQQSADTEPHFKIVDWHRAQLRGSLTLKARVKDLGGLYFSALRIMPLKRSEQLYFIRHYRDCTVREALGDEPLLWRLVSVYAQRTLKRHRQRDAERAPESRSDNTEQ